MNFLTDYFSYFTKRRKIAIVKINCGGGFGLLQNISLWEIFNRYEKQEKIRRKKYFHHQPLTLHTVVSVCGQQVLFYTIRAIKTFHLQVITHINRQNEVNITYVQTYSPGHKSILAPPTFVRGGCVCGGGGGNCHTEPVNEQQGPMHKARARAKRLLQPPRV